MGAPSKPGAITITPIFWTPPNSKSTASTYTNLVAQFDQDLAQTGSSPASGLSVLDQYVDATGTPLDHAVVAQTPIVRQDKLSTSGTIDTCKPDSNGQDLGPDLTRYALSTCVTDAQIEAEVSLVTQDLPTDASHLYPVFLAQGVEVCGGSDNTAGGGACSLNPDSPNATGGGFCAYHSWVGPSAADTGALYTVQPFPVLGTFNQVGAAGGLTCAPSGVLNRPVSPNGNSDFDATVTVYVHEVSEAITDPYGDAIYGNTSADTAGSNEIGDLCNFAFPSISSSAPNAQYDETMNGHHYLVQELFSNLAYAADAKRACVTSLPSTTPESTVTSVSLTGSPTVGSEVQVNVTIRSSSQIGAPPASGVVAVSLPFSQGCAAQITAGQASCSITPAEPGAQTLTARFVGDNTYGPSSASSPIDVQGPPRSLNAQVALSAQPAKVSVGSLLAVGITLDTASRGSADPLPTGTVEIDRGANPGSNAHPLCTASVSTFTLDEAKDLVGTCAFTPESVLDNSVTLRYDGDPSYNPSSSSETLSIEQAKPSLQFTSEPTNLVAGGPKERFAISIAGPSGVAAPTGTATVTFESSTCSHAVMPSASSVSSVVCWLSGSLAGANEPSVTYSGDSNYLSTSIMGSMTTTAKESTSTGFSPSVAHVAYRHQTTERFHVEVTPEFSGATPTGRVVISTGSTSICSITLTNGSGSCKLRQKQLARGKYHLLATYQGDTNTNRSKSSPVSLSVS